MAVKTKDREYPDLGLSTDAHQGVIDVLSTILADEHILYLKLRKYHWNVTGPRFHSLHVTFEEQYTALATTIDEIAERIVQYGAPAPGTFSEFKDMARLNEKPGNVPDANTMILNIVEDHETLVRHLRDDIETVSEKFEDVGAEDFLTGLLQSHQEQAWMLRAMVENDNR